MVWKVRGGAEERTNLFKKARIAAILTGKAWAEKGLGRLLQEGPASDRREKESDGQSSKNSPRSPRVSGGDL